MIIIAIFLGVYLICAGLRQLMIHLDQSSYERRRFYLSVAEELKRLDEIYQEKESIREKAHEERRYEMNKWWGRN